MFAQFLTVASLLLISACVATGDESTPSGSSKVDPLPADTASDATPLAFCGNDFVEDLWRDVLVSPLLENTEFWEEQRKLEVDQAVVLKPGNPQELNAFNVQVISNLVGFDHDHAAAAFVGIARLPDTDDGRTHFSLQWILLLAEEGGEGASTSSSGAFQARFFVDGDELSFDNDVASYLPCRGKSGIPGTPQKILQQLLKRPKKPDGLPQLSPAA